MMERQISGFYIYVLQIRFLPGIMTNKNDYSPVCFQWYLKY